MHVKLVIKIAGKKHGIQQIKLIQQSNFKHQIYSRPKLFHWHSDKLNQIMLLTPYSSTKETSSHSSCLCELLTMQLVYQLMLQIQ